MTAWAPTSVLLDGVVAPAVETGEQLFGQQILEFGEGALVLERKHGDDLDVTRKSGAEPREPISAAGGGAENRDEERCEDPGHQEAVVEVP